MSNSSTEKENVFESEAKKATRSDLMLILGRALEVAGQNRRGTKIPIFSIKIKIEENGDEGMTPEELGCGGYGYDYAPGSEQCDFCPVNGSCANLSRGDT
jgi:hypothetical protein